MTDINYFDTASDTALDTAPDHNSALKAEVVLPAIVSGTCTAGERFREDSFIYSLSPTCVELALYHTVEIGARIVVVVRLAVTDIEGRLTSCLALLGKVARCEPHLGGACSVEVRMTRHKFI